MISGLSLGSDNKRYFRGKLPRLAIGTIILMPLLYGAMYLWAFWNPFDKVNEIPAAIVNLDRGAENKGKPLHAGEEVTKTLLESDELDLIEMSASEAASKLANGSIYYTVTIPEDFSAAIVSAEGDNPEKTNIQFDFNDSNSYLATIIGEDASQQVVNKINNAIGGKAVEQVLVSVQDSGTELEKAVAGSGKLASGLGKAKKGTNKLSAGSKKLNNGLSKAKSGGAKLAKGTGELKSKLDAIVTPALRDLERGGDLKPVKTQATQLVEQAEALEPAIVTFEGAPLSGAIDVAVETLRQSDDQSVREVGNELHRATVSFEAQSRDVRHQTDTLASQLQQLDSKLTAQGGGDLERQLEQIDKAIATEVKKLRNGINKLNGGAEELSSGLGKLESGSSRLVKGVTKLNAGNKKLLKGANELHEGLKAGLKKVPGWSEEERAQAAKSLSNPVALFQEVDDEAATFGTGFAPFFCGLALFVGGILCWMLLTPLQSRAVVSGLGAYRTAFASYVPALLTGALQATVLFLVVTLGLGLEAAHALGMWLFMILMSATFLSIIQAFNALFDLAIGRVITLAFLMVALISAGGIYPVPTTATPFQVIHPVDPMTYTVNGLRQLTVSGAVDYRLWIAIGVLLGVAALALSLTAFAARRNRQYTMERLYPSIEV
jgi:putative membrane protein